MTTPPIDSSVIYETLVPGHEHVVLSLPPVWAWAILFGGKDVENRSWQTAQRGRVLIHASSEGMSLREAQQRRAEVSFIAGIARSALPTIFARGAILGSVEMVDCVNDAASKWAIPGKQHWLLRAPRVLATPIEHPGSDEPFWQWVLPQARSAKRSASLRPPKHSEIVPAVELAEQPLMLTRPARKRPRGA